MQNLKAVRHLQDYFLKRNVHKHRGHKHHQNLDQDRGLENFIVIYPCPDKYSVFFVYSTFSLPSSCGLYMPRYVLQGFYIADSIIRVKILNKTLQIATHVLHEYFLFHNEVNN